MYFRSKECRIYAACGVSQTPKDDYEMGDTILVFSSSYDMPNRLYEEYNADYKDTVWWIFDEIRVYIYRKK